MLWNERKRKQNAYNEKILKVGQGAYTTIFLPTNGGLGRRFTES